MHILVTNDDGVQAPGLLALAQEMRKLGQVTVMAPDRNWSISGHAKTMDKPLRVREVKLADGTPALTSDGSPSDCVALALLGVVKDKIDLVVSGINPNANIGHDVTYSGTVTAAMEAVIAGVMGIAVSLDSKPVQSPRTVIEPRRDSEAERGSELDYGPAARAAAQIVARAMAQGLPEGILLSINVPHLSDDEIKGIQVTRQGLRVYRDALDERRDPRGRPYYWIGGEAPTGVNVFGTDFGALQAGFISVTPLQLDLTARDALEGLKGWWE